MGSQGALRRLYFSKLHIESNYWANHFVRRLVPLKSLGSLYFYNNVHYPISQERNKVLPQGHSELCTPIENALN